LLARAGDDAVEARFVDGQSPIFQHAQFCGVAIRANHFVADFGQASTRHQADIACSDHRNLQSKAPEWRIFIACMYAGSECCIPNIADSEPISIRSAAKNIVEIMACLVVESADAFEIASQSEWPPKAGGMEILWPALGIGLVVVFLFIVFVQHWQRVLRHHSWTLRRLTERLRDLEDVGSPDFRRRIHETAPLPLEKVFTFFSRFDERFWRDTLHLSPDQLNFVRAFGSLPGMVKIERWRGHSVVSVTELLPESRLAGWQTRKLDVFSGDSSRPEALTIWQLPLKRAHDTADRPAALELSLRGNSIVLRRLQAGIPSGNGSSSSGPEEESILFRVPLDTARLAEFRSHEPMPNGQPSAANGNSWLASYSFEDENLGLDWQLSVRDLSRKSEWENWKLLDWAPIGSDGELQPADFSADAAGREVPARR
jgi:hypothetical protein